MEEGNQELRRSAEAYERLASLGSVSPQHFRDEFAQHQVETGQSVSERLYSYAVAQRRLVPIRDMRKVQALGDHGQSEHEVYLIPSARRVIKVTHAGKYGINHTLEGYLNRLVKLNMIAPGLDIRVVGVTPDMESGFPQMVTDMKYIQGTHPTPSELRAALVHQYGFEEVNRASHRYRNPESGFEIIDAHCWNFLKAPDGEFVPIDISVE